MSKNTRQGLRDFKIEVRTKENNVALIESKPMVKYLGIHLEQLLKLNIHIKTQIQKAKKAFNINKNIFIIITWMKEQTLSAIPS